jgi:hypothetical protein
MQDFCLHTTLLAGDDTSNLEKIAIYVLLFHLHDDGEGRRNLLSAGIRHWKVISGNDLWWPGSQAGSPGGERASAGLSAGGREKEPIVS